MAHPESVSAAAFHAVTESDSDNESSRTPVQSHDLIADIIADLVTGEEGRFSRPASSHHRNASVYSFEPLQQSDLDRIRPRSFTSFSVHSRDRTDVEEFHYERAEERRPSVSHDFVADVVDSLQPSKHSSLSKYTSSRPVSRHQDNVGDSAVSLFPRRNRRESAMSHISAVQRRPPTPPRQPEQPRSDTPIPTYPSPAKTAIILISLYISIFLVALDRTIVGPAIPVITDQFKSISDIGWYGSAYMLTSCGFILLYGRIYTFYCTKKVFLSGIVLFEAGSAICGAANSSFMLIMGRAIAGLGSSGIFTGAILIMMNTVPLHKRPMLQGLFGACFGVASVAGPLLGGAFTGSKLTWRWCFFINLPLGGFTILVVVFFLKLEENKPNMQNWSQTIKNLDPLGTALFLPSIICLILALEWAATDYAWNDPRIIALLVIFVVLFVGFVVWQYYTRNTTATVPGRILFQRSVACGGASQFLIGATMLTASIYIPLWFQAIKGVSAMQSGVNTIPLVLSVVVGSISSSALTQRIGYYTPFMMLGSCFMATGTGLLTTWNMATKSNKWISFQAILGFGVGCSMQHPNIAVQIVLAKRDVPTGTALLSLCQTLGGAVFVTVGQNTFIDKFTSQLKRIGGLDAEHLVKSGATAIKSGVPEALQQVVLEAYNRSLTQGPFFAALIVGCLALPTALGMEWRSVKENQNPPPRPSEGDEEKQEQAPEDLIPRNSDARQTEVSEEAERTESPQLAPPVPAWNKIYRSSGHFSQWMTAKVNPDLRSELSEIHLPRSKK